MKRVMALVLILALLAGAVGTAAFAAPGNSGKVHWKDQLIMDWEGMMEEYLDLKDELEDEGSLSNKDQARFDELADLLTTENKMAKTFYQAVRNHLNNKHYQPTMQNTVRVMNRFRNNFSNWEVLPFDSIISHKYNFLFDTPPMLADGRTLVPVRAITEGLGADVEWLPYEEEGLEFGDFEGFETIDLEGMNETADEWLDDEMDEDVDSDTNVDVVEITLGEIEINLFIDYPVAFVDDDGDIRWEALDTTPKVFEDRTYVPLRFVSETFGLDVTWDDGTIVINDGDEDDDDPVISDDIAREDDDVMQDPITEARYKLDVDFDASDYDVIVRSADGIDNGSSVDKMTYFEDEKIGDFELNGYYVGLAIDIPEELDQSDYDPGYRTADVVDVEWDNENIDSYMIVGNQLYVYLPVTDELENTSPNLEVRWELALDREYFDVYLDYLRFEDEPIEETVIDRNDNDVRQYGDVGGVDLDFDFDGDDKELDIDGDGAIVPFILADQPLPAADGYYVGIRVNAPENFNEEDLEYVEFNVEGEDPVALDEDQYDVNDNRLVYYLEIDPDDEYDELELAIKWAPEFVEETIVIEWKDLELEEIVLTPERGEDSVGQDPDNTGGTAISYVFDLEELTLAIQDDNGNGRYVAYYDGEGDLVNLDDEDLAAGYWIGIEILAPTNPEDATIKELTIDGTTWTDLDLDGEDNDRLWFYFEAVTGEDDFEIEILWDDDFETETITVDTDFGSLPEVTE